MASSLGDMVVNLKANTSHFVKNMKVSKASVVSFGKSALKIGAAIAASAFIAAGTAVAIFASQLKKLDEVAHQVKRTGLGTGELAGFTLAAELGGSSAEVASKALDKFTRNMGKAGDASSKTAKAFAMMGIDAKKLATLTPNQQLRETVRAISALPTEAMRANAAFQLFGKGSASLVEVLSGGVAELDAFNQEAELMGQALSGEQLQAIEDVDDAITRLGKSFTGAAGQITATLAPEIESLIQLMQDFIIETAKATKGMKLVLDPPKGNDVFNNFLKRGIASGNKKKGRDIASTPEEMERIIKETEKFAEAIKQAKIEGDILSGKMTEIDATIQKFAEAGVDPSILGQLRIQLQINKAIELGNKARKDADRDADRALKKRKRDNDRIAKDNERKTKGKEDFFFNEQVQKARDTVNKLKEKANKSPGFAGIAGRGSSEALEIIKRSRGPGKELLKEQKVANATLKSLLAEARARKLAQFDLQAQI